MTPTIGTRFMRSASQPSGIAPSAKNRPDAVLMNTTVPLLMWNVLAQLGLDGLHRVERELVERDQQPEHDEHERAALGERLAEVDRLGLDAGQHVVGEDDLLFGPGLGLLAGGFLVEHGRGERRGVAAPARRLVRCVHSFPRRVIVPLADRRAFLTRVSGDDRGFRATRS